MEMPWTQLTARSRIVLVSTVALSLSFIAGAATPAAASDPDRAAASDADRAVEVLAGGSVAARTVGAPGPGRKLALGMSVPDGRDLAVLDRFTASIGGHRPALWSIWSQWGLPSTREFPTAMVRGLKRRGVVPFIFWEPVDPRGAARWGMGFSYETILDGAHDAYIRRFARDAKASRTRVLLRFAHEINGAYFPWSINGALDHDVRAFKRAWRHVWRIFRDEGATNVKFVWSVVKQRRVGGRAPYARYYPGDRYVDYLGFSSYNWGAIDGKRWRSMYKGYERVTRSLAKISDKPIIAAETGSNHIGGDKARWIRQGYRKVYRNLPRVVAILYLDADLRRVGHPDWRLASPASALDAYADIAARPRFQGTLPGRRAR